MNARMIVAAVAVAAPLAVAAPASAAPARVNVPVLVGSRAAGGAQVSVWRWTGDGHRTARADTTGERRGLRNVTLTYRCGTSRYCRGSSMRAVWSFSSGRRRPWPFTNTA